MLGLLGAEGEMVAAETELDGVAQWRPADDFHLRAVAEPHLQKPAAQLRFTADGDDESLAADPKLIEAARFEASRMIAGGKPAGFFHCVSRVYFDSLLRQYNSLRLSFKYHFYHKNRGFALV
jgi:hypothetical protein